MTSSNMTPKPFSSTGGTKNHSVTKRLQNELMQLMMNTPAGISAFPDSESNLFKWTATIKGPEDTYYEGLSFKVALEFSENYPYRPPTVTFISPMYHPNVDMSGRICLDILQDQWSAVQNISSVLLSIQSLLGEPNNSSPLNGEAADLWNNPELFKKNMERRCLSD